MLFLFFLKRFLVQFLTVFFIIILILGASNLVLRAEFFSGFCGMIQVFFVMLPLMAIYATPLAAGVAVQKVVGDLLVNDELLVIDFFRSARKALILATATFSLMLTIVYAPLVFDFAPQSYLRGKRILLNLAKRQFSHLEPQKFHSPYPGLTFFFKEKQHERGEPRFNNIFLAFHSKDERYIFTANQGYFQQNKILMIDGSVHTICTDKRYTAVFKETTINLDKILNLEKNDKTMDVLKFWNIKKLLSMLKDNDDVLFEILKRLAQLMWLLLFPFLALYSIFIFGRKKSNMLVAVITSGVIFLTSYISIALAQVVSKSLIFLILFLYLPLILCLFLCIKFFMSE
ncbi:MAG: hypothetical protein US49_C0007G0037 [candidate division TM6 bacterium GW2011_GWF2_37_49]|nr:MAG: hypothetical protein US49_C0007G0037 [candidate division TM6 bacterium GW2011_GWF2_37_49]